VKKLTVIVGLLILVVGVLAGCSSSKSDKTTSSSSATSSAASTSAKTSSPTHGSTTPAHPTPTTPAAQGSWDANGNPVNGGPRGANGSTGNNLTQKYCAQNQDPGCPAGSYVGPNAIQNPNGQNNYVPCEGTICTNPNHGGGDTTTTTTTTAPPAPGPDQGQVEGAPCDNGTGTWVHMTGENADHYGTEWLCQHN